MDCQDCNKKEAVSLIFDTKKSQFFWVCEDCIKEEDKTFNIERIRRDLEW